MKVTATGEWDNADISKTDQQTIEQSGAKQITMEYNIRTPKTGKDMLILEAGILIFNLVRI